MGKRVSFSGSNLELHDVVQHHFDTENALKEYYDIDGKKEFLPVKFIGYLPEEIFMEHIFRYYMIL